MPHSRTTTNTKNSGGETIPASTWLELCRAAEAKEQFDRAVADYERLASAYPAERQSLLALMRSEEHTSELQSRLHLVCRLLLEKKKKAKSNRMTPCRSTRHLHSRSG